MALICHDDRRRNLLRGACLNGIDYAELLLDDDGKLLLDAQGRPTLRLAFLGKLTPEDGEPFAPGHLRIDGGRRVRGLRAVGLRFVRASHPERDDVAELILDRPGDHSPYTLRLITDGSSGLTPLADYDQRYTSVGFSFAPGGPVEVDCASSPGCEPPALPPPPELSYLAKDYASFRQLLLDRLATTLPGWRERHTPDLYLTLVELLAYVGDQLSYYQDAVATEAYLATARLRTSVRRHARLVDYAMHEGCNARAFVQVQAEGHPEVPAGGLAFLTRPEGGDLPGPVVLPDQLAELPPGSVEIFEPIVAGGREAIRPADIRRPRRLARRLRDERGGVIGLLRARLAPDTIALLAAAEGPPEGLPALIAALAGELNRLLDDPALALAGRGATTAAILEYGSLNALQGPCLCRHNHRRLHEQLPDELAPPATLVFHEQHNRIELYTWGMSECCLERGSTAATLVDRWEDEAAGRRALRYLRPGDLLLFEELLGPRSGLAADADPVHRHVVRLTAVQPRLDPLDNTPVVEVSWDAADALPFGLCLSARRPAPHCDVVGAISVARGNIVLVDHGTTVRDADPLALRDDGRIVLAVSFPPPDDRVPSGEERSRCVGDGEAEVRLLPGHYAPTLPLGPLVFACPLPAEPPPASRLLDSDPRQALPAVALFSAVTRPRPQLTALRPLLQEPQNPTRYLRWLPRRDLLASGPDDHHFAVEVADDGVAQLRFAEAASLVPGAAIWAGYRVGGGAAGNVGSEAIVGAILYGELRGGGIVGVRNPLPARGGSEREPVAEVRLKAPHAFRGELRRAITAADYARIVERDFGGRVQRAAATMTVTSSGRIRVVVALDPKGGRAERGLRYEVRRHLEQYRRIGHRLAVYLVDTVGLNLHLRATLLPHAQRGAVLAALGDRFSNRDLQGGAQGFFHPDRWPPGQPVAVSQIVAAALAVEGVVDARVARLDRRGVADGVDVPADGLLKLTARQVARLDNDPDNPEHGVLRISLEGGR